MSTHILNKLLLDITNDIPEKEANKASDAIFYNRITPVLEKVLKEYEDTEIVISEPLELNLGALPEEDMEYDLENAIRKALARYLPINYHQIPMLEHGNMVNASKPLSQYHETHALLDYINYPVIPWHILNRHDFDMQIMLMQASEQVQVSPMYARQLAGVLCRDLATCRRFFALPFSVQDFQRIMERVLAYVQVPYKQIYIQLLRQWETETHTNVMYRQQLLYYLLAAAKYGNEQDRNTSLFIAAMCMQENAVFSATHQVDKFMYYMKKKHRQQETSHQPMLLHKVHTWSTKLYQLLHVVKQVYQSSAPTKEQLSAMATMMTEWWKDVDWLQYVAAQHVQEWEDIDFASVSAKSMSEREISMAKILQVAQAIEQIQVFAHMDQGLYVNLPKQKTKFVRAGDEKLNCQPGIRELTRQIMHRQPEIKDRIPIYNAGLVLFQPFLISFFDRLGLLENRQTFKSEACQMRAAYLLHYLTGENEKPLEHVMFFNKLLCGINILFPLEPNIEITEQEKQECLDLLKAVIRNWSIIRNTSIPGFQESFVRRNGMLERSENNWILRVKSNSLDILLDEIPWDIRLHSYPWNDYLIFVEWN